MGTLAAHDSSAQPLDLLGGFYKGRLGKEKSSQATVVSPTSFPFKTTPASVSSQEELEPRSFYYL